MNSDESPYRPPASNRLESQSVSNDHPSRLSLIDIARRSAIRILFCAGPYFLFVSFYNTNSAVTSNWTFLLCVVIVPTAGLGLDLRRWLTEPGRSANEELRGSKLPG